MATRKFRYRIAGLIIVPAIALAFMASGCLWGVVKDAETGAGLPGMTVKYTDSYGNTDTAVTDAHGIYHFDQADGPIPAVGPVSFEITGPGYEPMTAARLVQYNDNPNATLSNLSTFWEAQGFNLTAHLVQRVQFSVSSVDVDVAEPVPPAATYQFAGYTVVLRMYDPDDLSTALCEDAFGVTPIGPAETDPAPQALDLGCTIPGDAFRAVVAVILQRNYLMPGPVSVGDAVVSTTSFDWIAPEPNTDWENDTLHGSSDPRLVFDANVRYRAVNGPESPGPAASDRNMKDNFASVDGTTVLARLAGIPILTWNYKADSADVRHMGPMAQDFYAAFGLGDTDKGIYSIDAQGVAFAAIQALYKIALEKDAEIDALQQQVDDLSARLAALEARLGQ
jgi:hypothetical protein